MQFRHEIEIDAPAERVWAVLCDVEAWPEWNPTVHRVDPVDAGPLELGRRYRIMQPNLPAAEWVVTQLSPGRTFTWQNRRPAVRVRARHRLDALGARSFLTLELDFFGPLGIIVGFLTGRLCKRYLRVEADGLKRQSERMEMAAATLRDAADRRRPLTAPRQLRAADPSR